MSKKYLSDFSGNIRTPAENHLKKKSFYIIKDGSGIQRTD